MTPRATAVLVALTSAASLSLLKPTAHAVQPQRWTHTTQADFEPGEVEGTVVTNLGDIQLAAATQTLDELPDGVTIIYDIEVIGDTTYLAAGPEGKLLKVVDGEASEVAGFENEQVFCLCQSNGVLIIGVSGNKPRIDVLTDEGKITTRAALPESTRYIWDIVEAGDPTMIDGVGLAVATGPEGKVFAVPSMGNEVKELLDTAQANVLCLATGKDLTPLYAGTDTEGLVYRIDASGGAFVVYDANEPEIGALLVMDDGTVYAGTADANQARPGRMEEAPAEEKGRPEEADEQADQPANEQQPAEDKPAEEPAEPEVTAEALEQEMAQQEQEEQGPTDAQRDALRELIRQKLLAARKSGTIKPTASRPAAGKPGAGRPTKAAAAPTGETEGGNAVYRIDPQGFVSTVFRDTVMVLKLVAEPKPDGGYRLLIATGSEGQVYRVDPDEGETSILIDLDAEQVLAMTAGNDGNIVLGAANPAEIITLTPGIATRGMYTSDVLDATHISLWGTFNLTANVPAGGSVTLETRSGNLADPEAAAWSEWSTAQVFMPDSKAESLAPREVTIASPPARFLQYRLTLTSDGKHTPSVGKAVLAYVLPNLAPKVASITAAYPEPAADQPPATAMNLAWEATDPNGDRLLYKVEYQPAGTDKWLTAADALAETSLQWQTANVPDGYYLLRVTADDRLDNPGPMARQAGRRSDPVLVDNTPPTLEDPRADLLAEERPALVQGQALTASYIAADARSAIKSISYTLDDADEATPLLPDDLIFDSTRETFSVTISDLSPGPHVVTLRVTDLRGNTTHYPVLFEVPRK